MIIIGILDFGIRTPNWIAKVFGYYFAANVDISFIVLKVLQFVWKNCTNCNVNYAVNCIITFVSCTYKTLKLSCKNQLQSNDS